MNKLETNRVQEIAKNIESQHVNGNASPLIGVLLEAEDSPIYQDEDFRRKIEYDTTCYDRGWEVKQINDQYLVIKKYRERYGWLYNPDDDCADDCVQDLDDVIGEEEDYKNIDSKLASIDESYFFNSPVIEEEVWKKICECDCYHRKTETEFDSHWDVSPWLAEKLEAQGEIVYRVFHMDIWCRIGAGTDVYMDEAILKIAASEEIQ